MTQSPSGRWQSTVLLICALTVTALVVRRELMTPLPAEVELGRVENWSAFAVGPRLGARDAPVTVTVFSDFQCPYCLYLAEQLDSLQSLYPDQLALVYRHFPVSGHAFGEIAALTSECARDQGRFWEYHDILFAEQGRLGTIEWVDLASRAGVSDLSEFEACVESPMPRGQLTADSVAARTLGVRGTPTFLINDRLFRGAMRHDDLRAAIEAAMTR